MKIITYLILTFAASLVWATSYSVAQYTPKACGVYLAKRASYVGPTIRGELATKIRNAFLAKDADDLVRLKGEGIEVGNSRLDGDFIEFQGASFQSIVQFFAEMRALKAVSDEVGASLEAEFMRTIGAVVYGDTAQNLYAIYINYLKENKTPIPDAAVEYDGAHIESIDINGVIFVKYTKPNASDVETGTVVDLRATSFADLQKFVDVISSASPYPFDSEIPYRLDIGVKSWADNARHFLWEAKKSNGSKKVVRRQDYFLFDENIPAPDPAILKALYGLLGSTNKSSYQPPAAIPPAILKRLNNPIFFGPSGTGKTAGPSAGASIGQRQFHFPSGPPAGASPGGAVSSPKTTPQSAPAQADADAFDHD